VSSVSYGIGIDVNGSQVSEHLFGRYKASLRVFVIPGLQVLLGVSNCTVKHIEHFVLLILEVIGIASEFALDLELPTKEHRIPSIREWDRVWQLL